MPVTTPNPYALADHDRAWGHDPQERYVMRVKDLAEQDRPREKLLAAGPGALSLSELVAVMWGVGTRKEDVLVMARRVVKEYGEKSISNERDPKRLSEAAGIPLAKACQIVVGLELGRRFFTSRDGRPAHVRTARQAFQYLKNMGNSKKEQLRGLYLNSRYQVVHDEVISLGSLTSNIVHPREVFLPAVERSAVAVIIAHNHPSGSLQATAADLEVTEQLLMAGQVLGIELLDHLIITAKSYVSILREAAGE